MRISLNSTLKWISFVFLSAFLWFIISSFLSADKKVMEQQQQRIKSTTETTTETNIQVRKQIQTITPEREKQLKETDELSELGFQ